MNNIKTEWVKALRSGEYKQIYGKYSNDEGCCAAGVLEKITGNVWDCWIQGAFRLYNYKGKAYSVVGLNDLVRLTFNEIADIIEEQY